LVCTLLVVASQVPSRIVKAHRFDQLERIGVMGGCEPGHLHIEFAVILRERAFKNACSDRARDLPAVPGGPLDHHYDNILGMVKWRETSKPRHVFLVTPVRGLRGPRLPRYHPIFQPRPATGPTVFVNNFPKSFAHSVNFIR
jgi:hypothetical protein